MKSKADSFTHRLTAVVSVGLVLFAAWRPAMASTTPHATSGPATAPSVAAAPLPVPAPMWPTAEPLGPLRAPALVRTRLIPSAVSLEGDPASAGWSLFDGDAATGLGGTNARVRARLSGVTAIDGIGLFGAFKGRIAVWVRGRDGIEQPIVDETPISGEPETWTRVPAKQAEPGDEVIVAWTPDSGAVDAPRELELWGLASPTAGGQASDRLADRLLTSVPAGAVVAQASPATASVAAPVTGADSPVSLAVSLDRDGRLWSRAFLVYELEGAAHWSEVPRKINGGAVQASSSRSAAGRGGVQVEEIDPSWLHAGTNQIGFLPIAGKPLGYRIKNARVVALPIGVAVAESVGPAAAALSDDDAATGLAGREAVRGGAFADLPLGGASQLDSVSFALATPVDGVVDVTAAKGGKLQRNWHVSVKLDGLPAGWNTIPLGQLPVVADGLRLSVRARGERAGATAALIGEARVAASPLPRLRDALVVSHPLHGECRDGQVYVRGFARTQGTVRIDGHEVAKAADGSFAATVDERAHGRPAGRPFTVDVQATLADGEMNKRTVAVDGCAATPPQPGDGLVQDEGAPFGQLVRAAAGATVTVAGVKLEVPPGALEHDTRITVRPLAVEQVPALGDGITNVTASQRAFRLGPHGLKFQQPVRLTVPYDRALVGQAVADEEIGVFYFDEPSGRWRAVDTDRKAQTGSALVAETTHFTDFIAATLVMPDHPSADAFNPNTIKDIKAADPATRVDSIAPPSASQSGSAHLMYPLWVPPGRAGATPRLAVEYDSDGANGWLGVGWRLSVSKIEVDTRFGVPRYDDAQESETYLLDGERLVPEDPSPARATERRYHRVHEDGSFDTIVRHRSSAKEGADALGSSDPFGTTAYTWEVIDKSGAHRSYGTSPRSRGSVPNRGIYAWHLETDVDVWQNGVFYAYRKTIEPYQGSGPPSVEQHLGAIGYTFSGTPAIPGPYVINFFDATEQRPDAFTSARTGTLVRESHLLKSVDLNQGTTNIYSYLFGYQAGEYGKQLLQNIDVARPDIDNNAFFYSHRFSYHKLPRANGAVSFAPVTAWNSPGFSSDGFERTRSEHISASAFGGWGPGGCPAFHGVVGGSFPLDSPVNLPRFLPTKNQDLVSRSFLDADGDGLPDFLDGGNVLLNRLTQDRSGGALISPAAGQFSNDVDTFNHSSNRSFSVQAGAHAALEAIRASLDKTWGHNDQDKLLADVDGDGLVDFVDSSGGQWRRNTGRGFGATFPLSTADSGRDFTNAEEVKTLKEHFHRTDPLIRWQAPYSGRVRLSGPIMRAAAGPATGDDGVTVTIVPPAPPPRQPPGPTWSRTFTTTEPCTPGQGSSDCGAGRVFNVTAGQRIHMDVNPGDNVASDEVLWSPHFSYETICDGPVCADLADAPRSWQEPSGGDVFTFDQAADFALSGGPPPEWRADTAGPSQVHLSVTLLKQVTSDDVSIEAFVRPSGNANATPRRVYPADATASAVVAAAFVGPIVIDEFVSVAPGDRISVRLSSGTPIDPRQITTSDASGGAHVDYVTYCRPERSASTTAESSQPVCGPVTGCTSDPNGPQCVLGGDPQPDQNLLDASAMFQTVGLYRRSTEVGYEITARPQFVVTMHEGDVDVQSRCVGGVGQSQRLLIQSRNRLVFAGPAFCAPRGGLAVAVPQFHVEEGEQLVFTAELPQSTLFDASWSGTVTNVTTGQTDPFVARGARARASNDQLSGGARGFYVAEWNGEKPFNLNVLQQNVVVSDDDPSSEPFSLLTAAPRGFGDVPGPVWQGAGLRSFIGPGLLSPSRRGSIAVGSGAGALRRSSSSFSQAAASLALGLSAGNGTSTGEIEFIDFNGDSYPDIVSDGAVRLGDGRGGFEAARAIGLGGEVRETSVDQSSVTLGVASMTPHMTAGSTARSVVSKLPSLGLSYSTSKTTKDLFDVNGDGLPDRVISENGRLSVRVNLGYELGPPVDFGPATWGETLADNRLVSFRDAQASRAVPYPSKLSSGTGNPHADVLRLQDTAGNNVGAGYSYFGAGIAYSNNRTLVDFVDVNGDGLVDQVGRIPGNSALAVKFNLGGKLSEAVEWQLPPWQKPEGGGIDVNNKFTVGLGDNDALDFSTTSEKMGSAGISYYDAETGLFGCFIFEAALAGGIGNSGSEMRLADIDGDGRPDQLLKLDGDDRIYVKRNPSGVENLLAKVEGPLGGSFELAYRREGNNHDDARTIDMPHNQFALASVTVHDGLANRPMVTTLSYRDANGLSSGKFDRERREDLGYAFVTTTRPDGSQVAQHFDTSDYFRKGILLDETEKTRDGFLFRKRVRTTESRPVPGAAAGSVVSGATYRALTAERLSFYEGKTRDELLPGKVWVQHWDYDGTGNLTSYRDDGDDGVADDVAYTVGYDFIQDPRFRSVHLPRVNLVEARDAGGNLLRKRTAAFNGKIAPELIFEHVLGGKQPDGQPYGEKIAQWFLVWNFNRGTLNSITDPNGFKLTYTYDRLTEGRIETITDSFGYKSTRTYSAAFGTPTGLVDTNGYEQKTELDTFGRPLKVFGPRDVGNAKPTIEFAYGALFGGGNGFAAPVAAVTHHKDEGRPDDLDTAVIVDGLGRVVQTRKDAERATASGGTEVGYVASGRVIFDERSRVWRQGQPLFIGGDVAIDDVKKQPVTAAPLVHPTTFSYDILSRLRQVQSPDANGTDRDPDGNPVATTTTDYGFAALDGLQRLTKLVRDAQGKLRTSYMTPRGETVGVVEQNTIAKALTTLTTRYSYDPLSRLTDVKDAAGHVTHAEYDGRGHMVVLDSPDSGRTEYRYDLAGNVAVKETANLRKAGKLIKYVYDFDRLKTIDYPDSDDVTYTYGAPLASGETTGAARGNNAGRIDRVTDESGSETRTYDELGELASMTKSPTPVSKWVPTFTYKMSYAYDQFGRATSMTYPDGEVVSYTYNAGGLLDTVKGAGGLPYVKHVGYDEFEQRVFVQLGNDAETTYTYDPTTRRLSDVSSGAAGTPLQRLHYNFDLVGNVKDVTNAVPLPTPVAPNGPVVPGPTQFTFAYDDLYQLTSATGRYQGCACGCGNERRFTLDLTYDGIGNISTKKQNDVIAWPSGRVDQQLATTYDWSYKYEGPRPHAPTHVSSREIVYDDDGNQKAVLDPSAGRSLTWTEEDRLRSDIDGFTTSFLYDADGNRTHKRRTTLETVYVNPYYVIRNGLQQTKHIVAGDSRIMSATSALSKAGQPATAGLPTQAYYHPDHLQSTSYVTDASGRILQHDEYFPTGEVWFEEVRNKDSRNRQPWLFNAKELDETGLYYYGARYYDPRLSQWVSPDPILASYMRGEGVGGVFVPENLSLYSYGWNNPVTLRDADGNIVWVFVGAAVAYLLTRSNVEGVANAPRMGEMPVRGPSEVQKNLAVIGHGRRLQSYLGAAADVLESLAAPAGASSPRGQTPNMTPVNPPPNDGTPFGSSSGGDPLPNFDRAREEAFKNAGMTDPNQVEFSKVDPQTGTVTEFKGSGGAKVGYDGPHPDTPGEHHDKQHISWQSAGKRGAGAKRGNIPYHGPRHPSRPERK